MSSDQASVNLSLASANGIYFFSAMLPTLGDTQRLIDFGPALFARLEKVQAHKKDLEGLLESASDVDRTPLANALAEEQMLQQALDWIRNCDLESNP